MALSFKESKRMTDESPVMTMEATMEDARPVVDYDEDITTFDTGDQNFTRSGNYTWYDTFSDNDFSTVDTLSHLLFRLMLNSRIQLMV